MKDDEATVRLINEIRGNNVIWDTTDEYYNQPGKRYEAWVRISQRKSPILTNCRLKSRTNSVSISHL